MSTKYQIFKFKADLMVNLLTTQTPLSLKNRDKRYGTVIEFCLL